MGRFTNPTPQFASDTSALLSGGKLYFYANGTSTPQATYANDALTVVNPNPVVLDSAGRLPNVYASSRVEFRVVLKDSLNNTLWTRDDVQFSDAAELLALVTQLQDQINNLEIVAINQNPIKNSTSQVGTNSAADTLTGTFLTGNTPHILARVTGTVSAGTFLQSTSPVIGSTLSAAKCAGVTGDSSSVIQYAWRIGYRDALKFGSGTSWATVLARQESGVTATATLAIYAANAFNDFSAVTLLGSSTSSLASGTNTTLTIAGVNMAAAASGNGLEVRLSIAPGAAFTTKDFYATDAQFGAGSVAQAFNPPTYAVLRGAALGTYPVMDATGAVNVMAATVDEYLPALYDGLRVSVRANNTVTSTTPTLNINGLGAVTIITDNASAIASIDGEIPAGAVKDYVYRKATNRWQLISPTAVGARCLAAWSATGVTKSRDLMSNVTLVSYTKDTAANTVTWRFSFAGLTAFTTTNFIVVASGYNIAYSIASRVDDTNIDIVGLYADNAADAYDLNISATLHMSS